MKIETKIMPHTQYYVIPYSIDDLNNAVNHDSFIDIIQSAKPFVNTNDICVEEAHIMADNLPKDSTIFSIKYTNEYFMFFTEKNDYYVFLGCVNYQGRRFCEVHVEKIMPPLKEVYWKMIADERQPKIRDIVSSIMKTWQIGEKDSVKNTSFPIWAIHAAIDGKYYENMWPFCTAEEYAPFVDAVICAIADVLPQDEFGKIKKALLK